MPTPLVVFPDAEKAVIEYLAPALEAVAPGVDIDVRGAGPRFVRVRRVGGPAEDIALDHPTLDVLVWHDSDKSRMALAQHLWAVLRAANGEPTTEAVVFYRDTVLGPRAMPDPADDTKTIVLLTVTMILRAA